MKLDCGIIHSADIGVVVGEFHSTPIHEVNMLEVELREIGDAQMRSRLFLAEEKPILDLLPDEVVVDGIIRKITTKEVTDAQLSA